MTLSLSPWATPSVMVAFAEGCDGKDAEGCDGKERGDERHPVHLVQRMYF